MSREILMLVDALAREKNVDKAIESTTKAIKANGG